MGLWDSITGPKGYHLYDEHEGTALAIPAPTGILGDLFALDTDYILEMYVQDDAGGHQFIQAVAFPLHPESMQINRDSATQITPTLGYLPVREHSRNRNLNIRLRGRSGVAARQGHDREGSTIYKGGAEILQEFDAFLDVYQRYCHDNAVKQKTDPTKTNTYLHYNDGPFLVFRSFSNGIHLRVEPKNWAVTKDVSQSRFGYTWFLELQAYAPATPENPPRLFGFIQDISTVMASFLDASAAVISMAATAVDRTTELANSGRVALQSLGNAASAFGEVASSVRDLTNVPAGYLADLTAIAMEAVNAVGVFADQQGHDSGAGITSAESIEDELLRTQDLLATATETGVLAASLTGMLGASTPDGTLSTGSGAEDTYSGALPVSDLPTTSFRRSPGPFPSFNLVQDKQPAGITVPLPMFGSLETLAKRFYGTSTLWSKIATANKMPSAYTMTDGSPLVAGTPVFIPLLSAQLELARSAPTQDLQTDPMGTDIYIDAVTGDLELAGTSTTDIRTTRGASNLEQAIRLRLFATQGSSSYFPSYGLPEMVGTPSSAASAGWLASQLYQQLTRDPRILDMTKLSIIDEGDTLSAQVEVTPIIGETLNVIAPI